MDCPCASAVARRAWVSRCPVPVSTVTLPSPAVPVLTGAALTESVPTDPALAESVFAASVPAESVVGSVPVPAAHLGSGPRPEDPIFPTCPFYPANGPAFHYSNGDSSFDCPLIEVPCKAMLSDGRPCPLVTRFHAPYCMSHSVSLLGLAVRVSSTPDAGRGLFATRDFPARALLGRSSHQGPARCPLRWR